MYDKDESPEILGPEEGTVAAITKGEVSSQVSTARAYPRSMDRFRKKLEALVTRDEQTAGSMMYSLPRGKDDSGRSKVIEGPSARFAEALASAYGNLRIEARPIAEGDRTITSRGTAWDMENNVAIAFEVTRRITSSNGRRFGDDMIAVTANAAGSIALRNAVLKVVPKSEWEPFYLLARKTAIGDVKTLVARRKAALDTLMKYGAANDVVLAHLGRVSIDDIDLDDLAQLRGLVTAMREGDITVESAFGLTSKAADRAAAPQRASETAAAQGPAVVDVVAVAVADAATGPVAAAADVGVVHTVSAGGPMAAPGGPGAPVADDETITLLVDTDDTWGGVSILEVGPLTGHIAEVTCTRKASARAKPSAPFVLICADPLVTKLAAACIGVPVRAAVAVGMFRDAEVSVLLGIEAEG